MGGGGGGAGGAIRLAAAVNAAIGTQKVSVGAGAAGHATCGARGGTGAIGKIGIFAPQISGSSLPAFNRLQN
jgi:hypothetical protein